MSKLYKIAETDILTLKKEEKKILIETFFKKRSYRFKRANNPFCSKIL